VLDESDGIETMRASGRRLQEGLAAQAAGHGLQLSVTGPPQMPLLLFADDPEFEKTRAWAQACARHGVYLHPIHNWFLSTAHDEATIDAALERTDEALREVREALGADGPMADRAFDAADRAALTAGARAVAQHG